MSSTSQGPTGPANTSSTTGERFAVAGWWGKSARTRVVTEISGALDKSDRLLSPVPEQYAAPSGASIGIQERFMIQQITTPRSSGQPQAGESLFVLTDTKTGEVKYRYPTALDKVRALSLLERTIESFAPKASPTYTRYREARARRPLGSVQGTSDARFGAYFQELQGVLSDLRDAYANGTILRFKGPVSLLARFAARTGRVRMKVATDGVEAEWEETRNSDEEAVRRQLELEATARQSASFQATRQLLGESKRIDDNADWYKGHWARLAKETMETLELMALPRRGERPYPPPLRLPLVLLDVPENLTGPDPERVPGFALAMEHIDSNEILGPIWQSLVSEARTCLLAEEDYLSNLTLAASLQAREVLGADTVVWYTTTSPPPVGRWFSDASFLNFGDEKIRTGRIALNPSESADSDRVSVMFGAVPVLGSFASSDVAETRTRLSATPQQLYMANMATEILSRLSSQEDLRTKAQKATASRERASQTLSRFRETVRRYRENATFGGGFREDCSECKAHRPRSWTEG